MLSSIALSDYTSLPSEGQDWTCPKCTVLNSSLNVNCGTCIEGRNPHLENTNTSTLNELVLEQEKRYSEAAPKVERSITDRVKTYLGGWTCPICSMDIRFGNSCTSCGHSLNSVEPTLKQSLKLQKSSSSTLGNLFGSIRGSIPFLRGNKKPVSSASGTTTTTDTFHYPQSSVDEHRETFTEDAVLINQDENGGITDETISLEQGDNRPPQTHRPRAQSIDSGTYTMSDIASQAGHLEPSDSRYNSPIACTGAEPSEIKLSDMLTDLHQVVGWFLLGIHLGVPLSDLQKIRHQFSENVDQCKEEMLITYSKLKEPSWAEIVEALRRAGERALAVRLAHKYGVTLPEEVTESQEEESVSLFLPNGRSVVLSDFKELINYNSELQNTMQQTQRELTHFQDSLSTMNHDGVGFQQMDQKNHKGENMHSNGIDAMLVEKDMETHRLKTQLKELETQFRMEKARSKELNTKLFLLESEVTLVNGTREI